MQNNRASMFIPYKSLKGFDDYIVQKEKIIVERKELFEDTLIELDYKLKSIQIGDIITIIYKNHDYIKLTGKVSNINFNNKSIQIVKELIPTKDIIKIDECYSSIK